MKLSKVMVLVLLLAAVCSAVVFAYARERSPEYALAEIAQGIQARDYDKVAEYVDLPALVSAAYDESTAILCRDIEKLSRMYPQDWFFRHDTAFMTAYIEERREADKAFALRAMEMYLDREARPLTRTDGEARWIADETQKFLEDYDAQVVKVEEEGGSAVATIALKGHDTPYGRLAPELTLKAALEQQSDGRWKVVRVNNVKELFYPVVDGIENYWTMQGWQ